VQVIAEEFSPAGQLGAQLRRDLERLGYGFVRGRFVRISVLSQEDIDYLPETGREDLTEAAAASETASSVGLFLLFAARLTAQHLPFMNKRRWENLVTHHSRKEWLAP
jgi:hypothetical protein